MIMFDNKYETIRCKGSFLIKDTQKNIMKE